jgi:hypothetical protein
MVRTLSSRSDDGHSKIGTSLDRQRRSMGFAALNQSYAGQHHAAAKFRSLRQQLDRIAHREASSFHHLGMHAELDMAVQTS